MSQLHVIRKTNLFLRTETQDHFGFQQRIRSLMAEKVLPALADSFDNLVTSDEWLALNKIDVDLGTIEMSELDDVFIARLLDALRVRLQQAKLNREIGPTGNDNPEETFYFTKVADAFFHFLQTGVLPWWFGAGDHSAFEDKIIKAVNEYRGTDSLLMSESFVSRFMKAVEGSAGRSRLAWQFSVAVQRALLKALTEWCSLKGHRALSLHIGRAQEMIAKSDVSGTYRVLSRVVNVALIYVVLRKLNGASVSIGSSLSFFAEICEEANMIDPNNLDASSLFSLIFPGGEDTLQGTGEGGEVVNPIPSAIIASRNFDDVRNASQTEVKHPVSRDGVMIGNAGLVIVAPFLPQLFRRCNLVEDDKLLSVHRAVAILRYVVYGSIDYREYQAFLDKVLCGIPKEEQIIVFDKLNENEMGAVDELLDSVVTHWSVLKSTSREGLREAFLQRPGRIVFRDEIWELKVEQSSFDVLLNDLPWTIGLIRLPWMQCFLRTEWI
jgi:hypothetical protein